MSYVVSGLPLGIFEPLFGLSEATLAARGVVRIIATADGLFRAGFYWRTPAQETSSCFSFA